MTRHLRAMPAEVAEGLIPDNVIGPDHDPWDDDFDDEPCCYSADLLRRLLADVRDAASQLDELDGAAREVGHWLRTRAQRAAIDAGPALRGHQENQWPTASIASST